MRFFATLILLILTLTSRAGSGPDPGVFDEKEEEVSVSILSWNIYMLPPFAYITGKRKRAKVLGDYFAESDFDMLVLQETFHHGARRKIKKRTRDSFEHRIGPANRRYVTLRTNSGIWILSKIPMEKLAAIKFKEKVTADDRMARKGALMVEATKDGQTFQVVGTHLNAGGPFEVRHSQAEQIRDELILPFQKDGVPQIIAGDMNMTKLSDNYAFMLETFGASDDEIARDPDYQAEDCPHYNLKFETNTIDYIFYRANGKEPSYIFRYSPCIAGEWVKDCKRCDRGENKVGYESGPDGIHYWLSDHPPIAVDISW